MSSIRISGDTSGYYDLTVPNVAGSNTIPLNQVVTDDGNGNLTVTGTLTTQGTTTISGDIDIQGNTNIGGVGSEAAGKFTINNWQNSSAGHIQFQTAMNTAGNGYSRANIVMARNKDQIYWDNDTSMWVHAGGSSTDWTMFQHTAGETYFYAGTSSGGYSKTNTDFINDHMFMKITQADHIITTPKQPRASLKLNDDNSQGGQYNTVGATGDSGSTLATVIFETAVENVGNHYSTSTGRFTCPADGTYFVSCNSNLNMGAASGVTFFEIHKNGQLYMRAYDAYGYQTNTWYQNGLALTVPCSNGDYLEIKLRCNGGHAWADSDTHYTHASFYLLA